MQGAARGKLDWVEAGRGLAAAVVMVSHVRIVRPLPFGTHFLDLLGTTGVAFFFVLSGFIMIHVHYGDLGDSRAIGRFAWRRIARIFPTYYLVLAGYLAINQLIQRPEARVPIDAAFLIRQLLLWPGQPLFLGPAWTLRHELFFYLMFSGLLANLRFGIALFTIWGLAILGQMAVSGIPSKEVDGPQLIVHFVNLYFFGGIAVGLAERHGLTRRVGLSAGAVSLVLLIPFCMGWASSPVVMAFGLIAFFTSLLALTVLASSGRLRPPVALLWLGAISYALYLVHIPTFVLLRGVVNVVHALEAHWVVRCLIQIAVAMTAAALIHRVFERPVLAWASRRGSIFGISLVRSPARARVARDDAAHHLQDAR